MKNKRLLIILSSKYQEMREGEFAWYNFENDSYKKIIKALDEIQEDEAKNRNEENKLA